MLGMPTSTDQYRCDRITDVLKVLDLTFCQNTLIGIPGRLKGLSDGERRRLTFASVVLMNPSLILIDEPTSGE
jgi:ATP-binding cassette, subfamily G (WHITE), eye pigment precursor transporter